MLRTESFELNILFMSDGKEVDGCCKVWRASSQWGDFFFTYEVPSCLWGFLFWINCVDFEGSKLLPIIYIHLKLWNIFCVDLPIFLNCSQWLFQIALEELAERVNGDMRMAVNQLQYMSLSMSIINYDDIRQRFLTNAKDEDISPFTAVDKYNIYFISVLVFKLIIYCWISHAFVRSIRISMGLLNGLNVLFPWNKIWTYSKVDFSVRNFIR